MLQSQYRKKKGPTRCLRNLSLVKEEVKDYTRFLKFKQEKGCLPPNKLKTSKIFYSADLFKPLINTAAICFACDKNPLNFYMKL